jgi:hypothetical protein
MASNCTRWRQTIRYRVFKVIAAFLLGLPVDFRCFPQCALRKRGTLKVDKLDRLPLLHIHRNQSKVRTALHLMT